MRSVVIFVEGSKDAYFLYELFLQRFSELFSREKNKAPEKQVGNPPFRLIGSRHKVEIYWTGGYKAVTNLAQRLKRPAAMEDSEEFVSAIIFDSDEPPAGRRNEESAGQQERRRWLLDELNISSNKRNDANAWIFLFPSNDANRNGELEDVLRDAVRATELHSKFFDECWSPFADGVKNLPANMPTKKSMMNEFKAAFNSEAWEVNGLNRCYSDATLWDWGSPALNPLVEFLNKVISGSSANSLSECLP